MLMKIYKMESKAFFKFIQELNSRLDFQFYNPEFDKIKNLKNISKYSVIKLGSEGDNKILLFIAGGTTPKKLPIDSTPEEERVLFIKNENIKNGELDLTEKYYIFKSDYEKKLKKKNNQFKYPHIKKGDILLSMTGTLGNACLIREDIEASINQNVVILRLDKDKIDLEFMNAYLNSKLIKKQIEFLFTSAQTPYLNEDKIKSLEIVLPDKTIQIKIINKFNLIKSEIIKAIIEQKKLLNENEDNIPKKFNINMSDFKPLDYYSCFIEDVNYRLDFVWNNPKLKKIWKILKDKGAIPITNFILENIDYGITDYGIERGETQFINIENINFDWRINQEGLKFINGVKKEKKLSEREIIISRSRLVGLTGLITNKEKGYTFGSYLLRLIPKNKEIPVEYIVNYFNSKIGRLQTFLLQTGSAGSNINPDQIKQILILIDDEQEEINRIIKDNFNKVYELIGEITKKKEKISELFLGELIKSEI